MDAKMRKQLKLKDSEYYDWNGAGKFSIPRCQFLLHRAKAVEDKILDWYKKNYTSCGDDYSVRITSKGKWAASHSNDCPLQHGKGGEVILTEEQFMEATKGGH